MTSLINEIAAIPGQVILIFDDYHLIDARSVHDSLNFLLGNQPPNLHLVIATREDPPLPLSRLRARGQLTELRAADLRFTSSEAAEFLNQVMGLDLSTQDIAALEARTEGWIAGLQLAAISLQGKQDATRLIESFSGSHRFVLDYLIEEVLDQQPEDIKTFLFQTAILNRLTGSLCDALTGQNNGQQILEYLERANLFVVPLDNERRWFRYHHLFTDLLRQRLHQSNVSSVGEPATELHIRASKWYEENGLEIEAFQHAAAANDMERAERLIEGDGVPVSFRGALGPVLTWLETLPAAVLDARPSLWVTYAMAILATGQTSGVEEKLQAAEAALLGGEPDIELDAQTRDLLGRIADTRANLAIGQRQVETIITHSRRALEYLHPDNLTYRTATTWKLGVAYEFQGDRLAARQAFTEAIAISQASGNIYTHILATTGLGNIQLAENQLYQAAETYWHALQLVGDLPIPISPHVYLCLARIYYQWNDLDAAQQYGQQSLQLARPFKDQNDIFVAIQVFLARLKLAQGDVAAASAVLAEAGQSAHQHNFLVQVPEVAAVQILAFIRQGNLAAAAGLAEKHKLPISSVRVHLARGDASAALVELEPLRQQMEAKGWQDERLKIMVLQAVALDLHGEKEKAVQLLSEALALAEPGGFIRIFVDEGPPMAGLLHEAANRGTAAHYIRHLLAAFPGNGPKQAVSSRTQAPVSELVEPLSEREIEVLRLIAEGLTNSEIASRLYLSLNTVKVHTRNVYGKLGVNNRTQAVVRGTALGILPPS